MSESQLLKGRTALIIGGSRGIGAAIARRFGAAGAAVAVNYHRNADAAKSVVGDIEAAGSSAVAVGADAADPDQVAAAVREAVAALGDFDVLVCNAAGQTDDAVERYRAGLTDAVVAAPQILDQVHTQLAASLYPVREVVPGMRRRGGGSIVFIGATSSRGRPPRGTGEITIAKSAQDSLARVLAAELGGDGIRVNMLAPGMVPTDANAGPHQEAMIAEFGKQAALGRVSSTDDVAGVALALASGMTGQLTGAYLGVDGGAAML
ncbi:3-oxoacyl-[acyl-carrier protein] reductase [Actinomadura meyerae]|uniref:3-oxoacyl-[acyl-carrier protein] reductase n=1 Tax=Actinomadura meyerae TaxID=240840 RepID=A0A239NFT0_9ACTN|nr:SDR family oxidoreductase [Actinomadura meyerae]SNT53725.1 3-oxoacyl-[acyl-carrier protein] reductase [Actinomadura meyerae]